MKPPSLLLCLALVSVAAGCAHPGMTLPPQTSASDLRAKFGPPDAVRKDASGDELWDYTTGPMGTQTYRFRVGSAGAVKDRTQIITQERFLRIHPGVTKQDGVLDLLGPPSKTHDLRNGVVWEWRMEQGATYGHYAIRFAPGTDVAAERIVIYDRSDDSRDPDR